MKRYTNIMRPILKAYGEVQALYLFGSHGTADEWPNSDVDIAVLLPVAEARQVDCRQWMEVSEAVARAAGSEKADLVNLRSVDTVFRMTIINTGRRVYCADEAAADEFEMLTLSLYQQLQEERKEIIEDAIRSGRIRHA